ncbi:ELWxxDGT repeat protein [Falsiroseomonas ponticola]|uniref:ELWxxDGT repeat protein n=1 Tax=Falsiroseomonas ponticola TaxID=2786951 RepID=UPI001933B0EA|nr:ELWxxDGT repeat protein [Roseomonas ponticola]
MPTDGMVPTPGAAVLDPGSDSGLAGDGITAVTAPTISGTTVPNAVVSIYVDGDLAGQVNTADGSWTFALGPLDEGTHSVTVSASTDSLEPSELSPPLEITIDTTAPANQPTIRLDSGSDSGVVGDLVTTVATPDLRGIATPFATVEILRDGVAIGTAGALSDGSWSFTIATPLSPGDTTLVAREVDEAGNAGPSSRALSLLVAGAPPLAPELDAGSDGGLAGDGVTNDNTPTIRGTAEAFADIRLLVGGRLLATGTADADGNWSITPTQALADGRHELRVQTVSGGIVSDVSLPLTLVIDTVAPATNLGRDIFVTADPGTGVRQWFASYGGNFLPATDIAPGGAGGVDPDVAPVVLGSGNRILFAGDDGVSGRELWVTDGTDAGTARLTDRAGSFEIRDLTATGDGRAVFTAIDSMDGTSVWVTDGSAFGTYALTAGDLFTAPPGQFTAVGDGRVFFVAETAAYGREVWVTDGTAAGTALFLDAAPGAASGQAGPLAALDDGSLLFVVQDGGGVQLLRAEGSTIGAVGGWDAFGGAPLYISDIVPIFGDVAIVIADVPGMGEELFLVSGDMVVGGFDLTPGPDGSAIQDFTVITSTITLPGGSVTLPEAFVFTFEEAGYGRELGFFSFDGVAPSGGRLIDIAPGADSANITGLTSIGDGRAVFSAEDVAGNAELWITDGTSDGTYLVKEIRYGAQGSAPRDFTMVYPGLFLFTATDDRGDREIWISDGTEYGTVRFDDINRTGLSAAPANPAEIVALADGRVLFNADAGGAGTELWVSDGTRNSAYRLTDGLAGAADGNPSGLLLLPDQRVLFTLEDAATGRELWVTDGTAGGTALLADINPAGASDPAFLTLADPATGRVMFTADDGTSGRELWVTDGTAAGTTLVADIRPGAAGSDIAALVVLAPDKVLFAADDGVAGLELWVTDGTAAGTSLVLDIDGAGTSSAPTGITVLGDGRAVFAARGAEGNEVWITDGTAPGTVLLADLATTGDSDPAGFTAIGGGRAIFVAGGDGTGREVWITDGSAGGTTLLRDIKAGAGDSGATGFTVLSDGRVLFTADDGIHGAELWITDGTDANTVMLADTDPGAASGAPTGMVETIGGRVVFTAITPDAGRELWVFDQASGDTYMLADIKAGAASSDPFALTRMADGSVVFWADDGLRGRELWITDGTLGGTQLFSDTNRGTAPSNPLHFTPVFTPYGMEAPALDETSDTRLFDNDRLTNDTTPLVWGYGEAGATATILVNDVAVGTAVVDSYGVWELDLPTLAEGTHAVTFTLSDLAGNVSVVSAALEFTIDTTPPTVTFEALPAFDNRAPLNLRGTVSEGSASVRLDLAGPAGFADTVYPTILDEGGGIWSWSYSIAGAARGDWTVTATGIDLAGNETAAPPTQTITFTNSATPVLTDLSPAVAFTAAAMEAGAVRLDRNVTVTDPDGAFFAGRITVSGQRADDVIGVGETGGITVAGSDLIRGGAVIGSVTGGSGGADLVIALAAEVPVADVEALVEALTFRSDVIQGEARRILTITLDDGLGGVSASTISVTLAGRRLTGGAEDETLAGSIRADVLDGRGGDDLLQAGAGADTMDGGLGRDTMEGGAGGDRYIVDDADDSVVELAGGGDDIVLASVTYALSAEVERLTLTGGAAIGGTGNALANLITGNDANNLLRGEEGNDTLVGGLGQDTMEGGAGNDVYTVDDAGDVVTELAGGGIDLVNASVTYALSAEVERLTLTGGAAIDGTGNALANLITGNAAANLLRGAEGNDTLNGGLGRDTMEGGTGDDAYFVDDADDVVTELAGGGIDLVYAAVTYTLGGEVERLTLTGSAAIDGTGNALANRITGNDANNLLRGEDGNDTLVGGLGQDTMEGGAGNDVYTVDDAGDVVTELAGGGNDLVNAAVTYALGGEVERLALTGSAAIDGTGNELANAITGNAAANLLQGGGGNDSLAGGLGSDTLAGGAGRDRFVFVTLDSSLAASPDLILDFVRGEDRVEVNAIDPSAAPGNQAFAWIGGAAFSGTGTAEARTWQDGGDTYAAFDDGSGGEAEMVIRFSGLLNLAASDFVL